jgi:hypothetical protein
VPIQHSVSFNAEYDGGSRRMVVLIHRDLTDRIIGLAIEVHRTVGLGPL